DTISLIYGIYVRPYPTHSSQDALGTSTPPTKGIGNVLKRGYMTVLLRNSTAAVKNGAVYVRLADPATGTPAGGLEAAADSTDTDVLSVANFMGAADAAGCVEIAYNI